MADHRSGPACQHSSGLMSERRGHVMPHQIDATMYAMQPMLRQPARDRTSPDPGIQKLGVCHDTML